MPPDPATLRGLFDEESNEIIASEIQVPVDSGSIFWLIDQISTSRATLQMNIPDLITFWGALMFPVGILKTSVSSLATDYANQRGISIAEAYRKDEVFNRGLMVVAQLNFFDSETGLGVQLYSLPWIYGCPTSSTDRRGTEDQLYLEAEFTPFMRIYDWSLVKFSANVEGHLMNGNPSDDDLVLVWTNIYNHLLSMIVV